MKTLLFGLLLLLSAPVSAQDFSHVVRDVKLELLAAGYRFHISIGDEGSERGRCDAAQITWRAAFRLSQSGHPIFLIAKGPAQNGCTAGNGQRYSHDALVYSGTCIDVLHNSETENEPAWNICTNPVVDPVLWRPTFALDPIAPPPPPPTPEPRPTPAPVPTLDLTALYQRLDALAKRQEEIAEIETQRWVEAKGIWDEFMKPFFVFAAKFGAAAGMGAMLMKLYLDRRDQRRAQVEP
jgi:hypothetical protein